jgi:hypothetical protein
MWNTIPKNEVTWTLIFRILITYRPHIPALINIGQLQQPLDVYDLSLWSFFVTETGLILCKVWAKDEETVEDQASLITETVLTCEVHAVAEDAQLPA